MQGLLWYGCGYTKIASAVKAVMKAGAAAAGCEGCCRLAIRESAEDDREIGRAHV